MALAKEVNKGPQDLLVFLVLLDKMVSLGRREKEEPLVRKEKAELLGLRVPPEALAHPVLLVPKVSRVNVAVLAVLVLLAFLVLVVFLVPQAITGTQDPLVQAVLQARMGPRVPQVTQVLLEIPECLDQKVMLASQERRGHPAPKALREPQAR